MCHRSQPCAQRHVVALPALKSSPLRALYEFVDTYPFLSGLYLSFPHRFLKSDPLRALYDFVDTCGPGEDLHPGSYLLVTNMPRQVHVFFAP
jgi:hypothetical protein